MTVQTREEIERDYREECDVAFQEYIDTYQEAEAEFHRVREAAKAERARKLSLLAARTERDRKLSELEDEK